MTPHRAAAVLILCLVAATGYWGWQTWQLRQPGFHERDCWFKKIVTGPARCGFFVVRENRQAPDSRTIRLPVVIFEAQEPSDGKESILYLTGGPGGQAYIGEQKDVDNWWYERHIFPKGHNLIVMGQRGTGLKEPDFDCEEFETPAIMLEAHPRGTPPPDVRALKIEAARACIERLQAEGVDLTAYNNRESAADIAELRRALGIEEWDLYGISYGTRLALSVLRYHPEGVRAVILDSVYPPEASMLRNTAAHFRSALYLYLTGCNDVSACDSAPNGNWARYLSVREILRRQPVEVDLGTLDSNRHLVVTVDDRYFDWLLFQALYAYETRRLIDKVIRSIAERGAGSRNAEVPVRDLFRKTLEFLATGSDAVNLSHICHEEAPFDSAEDIAAAVHRAGSFSHLITSDRASYLCPLWPAGQAAPVENTPVTSDVPVLLLAGRLDPTTPPDLARSAAAHLPRGYLFEFAEAGHGILYEVDCIDELIGNFLADPGRRPSRSCEN